jgi:hypothetical protein
MRAKLGGLALVTMLVLGQSAGCESKSSGSGGGGSGKTSCGDFCSALQDGDDCGELDRSQCKADCEETSASCEALAPELLDCLVDLQFTCIGPGYAVASGADDPGLVATLYSGTSTLEVHDQACGERVLAFQTCDTGSSSSATSGAGGSSSASTSSTGASTSSATTGSGGSGGGGNNCPPDHPVSCGGQSCWTADVDCASVTLCDGDEIACSQDESAQGQAVDCAYLECVPTAATCAQDASYPVFCDGRNGTTPACWSTGTICQTVVACGSGNWLSCSQGDFAVDCSAEQCLTPTLAESSDGACGNQQDDDGNGYIDCDDFHCLSHPSLLACDGENDEVSCTDGVDNDGNGFKDCADFACQASPAVTACNAENDDTSCHDGLDNDGDGKKDCFDASCYGSAFVTCP